MYKVYQVKWVMIGQLEIVAKSKDEAEERVFNGLSPQELTKQSIMLDVEIKDISVLPDLPSRMTYM